MKKILVVDDETFMLTVISDILSELNYAVTTVNNGKDACSKIEAERYDLIITDLNMPVMDGLEFTSQARKLPNCKYVPIVMLSSEEDSNKIATARTMGISTFLRKPPRKTQLQNILQVILNKRCSVRIPVQLKVFWGENDAYSGTTSNLSTSGLFVETDAPLPAGKKLVVKLKLPDTPEPISCSVQVAWTFTKDQRRDEIHPAGMGLEIIDSAHQARIKSFLDTVA